MEAKTSTLISDRNIAERRLAAIVKAVDEHESEQRRKPYPRRSEDFSLYQRTKEIIGEAS
jgi:hypothetical protein